MAQRAKGSRRSLPHAIAPTLLLCLAAQGPGANGPHLLHYTARLHGIPLLDITYCIDMTDTAYTTAILARTLGLAEFLVHGRSEGHAHGTIAGLGVKPEAYDEQGRLSGKTHKVAIEYPNGDPVLRVMQPPQDQFRLPIPPEKLAGAIDGLSAIVLASLVASRTGACQGEALIFDGFQLRRGITHAAGTEVLKPNPRSIFAGTALRCETESDMLGGYLKNRPVPGQAKPRYSVGWFGKLSAGSPDLPLKLSFDADVLGDIVVDLDRATAPPGRSCSGAVGT